MKTAYFSILFSIILFTGAIANAQTKTLYLKVGDMKLIPISDRQADGNTDNLIGYSTEDKARLTPEGKVKSFINTFLLVANNKNILIDTGLGNGGLTMTALANMGIKPDQIDYIIITHMHRDHFGALTTDNKKTFPNATIFISKEEYDFWHNAEIYKNANERTKSSIDAARQALAPYAPVIKTFIMGENVMPGVDSVAMPGHTVGHTGLLIESKGEKILIIADLVHVADVQFLLPDVYIGFDNDGAMAVKTRKAILERVANEKLLVAGMHLPFPAIGSVTKSKDGKGYIFTLSNLKEGK